MKIGTSECAWPNVSIPSGAAIRQTNFIEVTPACFKREAAATAEYEGKTYYFCNVNCKKDFEEDPEAYLHAE